MRRIAEVVAMVPILGWPVKAFLDLHQRERIARDRMHLASNNAQKLLSAIEDGAFEVRVKRSHDWMRGRHL